MLFVTDLSREVRVPGIHHGVNARYARDIRKWVVFNNTLTVTRRTLTQAMKAFRTEQKKLP